MAGEWTPALNLSDDFMTTHWNVALPSVLSCVRQVRMESGRMVYVTRFKGGGDSGSDETNGTGAWRGDARTADYRGQCVTARLGQGSKIQCCVGVNFDIRLSLCRPKMLRSQLKDGKMFDPSLFYPGCIEKEIKCTLCLEDQQLGGLGDDLQLVLRDVVDQKLDCCMSVWEGPFSLSPLPRHQPPRPLAASATIGEFSRIESGCGQEGKPVATKPDVLLDLVRTHGLNGLHKPLCVTCKHHFAAEISRKRLTSMSAMVEPKAEHRASNRVQNAPEQQALPVCPDPTTQRPSLAGHATISCADVGCVGNPF